MASLELVCHSRHDLGEAESYSLHRCSRSEIPPNVLKPWAPEPAAGAERGRRPLQRLRFGSQLIPMRHFPTGYLILPLRANLLESFSKDAELAFCFALGGTKQTKRLLPGLVRHARISARKPGGRSPWPLGRPGPDPTLRPLVGEVGRGAPPIQTLCR